jgi:NAD(P)-dependent dehydrogenase (short-subunit alcohol dehydrogenase family)
MPKVLITGANRGIGLEFARQYAADGWDVIATAREPDDADELKALDIVRLERLELGELDAVAGFKDRIEGPLDLFISNAGTWKPENIANAGDARAWAGMMVSNAISPTLLARTLAEKVAAAKGKMIAITSGMGSIADNNSGGYIPYRSSKAALNMAWHSLAIDRRDIVFAVLNPGWVKTRMGGPQAPTPPADSVAAMRRVIERLGPADSGGFFNHDGRPYPW